jgi:hypothetical protein
MPRAGFEPATPATKRLQTYALERVATGIGTDFILVAIRLEVLSWQYMLPLENQLYMPSPYKAIFCI